MLEGIRHRMFKNMQYNLCVHCVKPYQGHTLFVLDEYSHVKEVLA